MSARPVAATPNLPPPAPARGAEPGAGDAAPFGHQLDAARQRIVTHAPEHPAPDHSLPGRHAPDPRGPGPRTPEPGHRVADPGHGRRVPTPRGPGEPPTGVEKAKLPDMPAPDDIRGPTTATAAAAPIAQELADAAAEPAESSDDTAASALAGAMLALLGPSAGALRAAHPGTPAALPGGAKSVATDTAAALLQVNATATAPAATVAVPAAAGVLALAADLVPLATKKDAVAEPGAALALPGTPAPAAAVAAHALQLPAPVGTPAFAQDLGQHVAWLGGQTIKQARIRLHPEELGSLDVHVSVNHGRVDVVITAQHPGAVAAVQQSLPQLDHMLAQHGLSLGHAEVGQHGQGGQHEGSAHGGAGDVDGVVEIQPLGASIGAVSPGLLDAFA